MFTKLREKKVKEFSPVSTLLKGKCVKWPINLMWFKEEKYLDNNKLTNGSKFYDSFFLSFMIRFTLDE